MLTALSSVESSVESPPRTSLQFVNETKHLLEVEELARDASRNDCAFEDSISSSSEDLWLETKKNKKQNDYGLIKPGKKTRGRVRIKMEFIRDKVKRYTTFSKRKTGIMKKAYELAQLTGAQLMLLVASETGHVYTFATKKLQPMITSSEGKALIEACLSSEPASSCSNLEDSLTTSKMGLKKHLDIHFSKFKDEPSLEGVCAIKPSNSVNSIGESSGFLGSLNQADNISASISPVDLSKQVLLCMPECNHIHNRLLIVHSKDEEDAIES